MRELPLVSREDASVSTVVEVGEGPSRVMIGGGHFAMIAGPCSEESESQIISIAHAVKAAGASLLRGGAFKPRTSPYDFQGMGMEGLKLLLKAKEETGLPIVSEIMSEKYLDFFVEHVDMIQVAQHAELRASQILEPDKEACPPEAWLFEHCQGVAFQRRVSPFRRQQPGCPVRTRNQGIRSQHQECA